MIGTLLHDRWRILANLGHGGMGDVYLAEHVELGRKEALKIVTPSRASDPQFVSRFRREARAVNRLRHPNIIAVYGFGQLPDDRFYLAMEYADGASVHQLLARDEVFAVPRALHILGQLAYAVHHAHSRGVVHRDLKPANLILVGDQVLKVLDFGIAKIVAADHAESAALSSGNIVFGTPNYMSPERACGVGNDPRIDLYAIGCIAFELVVGATPFTGAPNEVIRAHLTQPPEPPSSWRPSLAIPAELDAVILRCLAKRPEDRYQTAAELFAALTKVPGYPAPRSDRRRFVPMAKHPARLESGARPDAFGLRGTLKSVAEALIDRGCEDQRLISGVAYLCDHEQALARLEAAQDALELDAAAVRETIGDREISLRFALGELAAAPLEDTPQRTAQIGDLEARLAAALRDGERLPGLDHEIASVAALRADELARLKTSYDALEAVVDELLAALGGHPAIQPLVQRLALVRASRTPVP